MRIRTIKPEFFLHEALFDTEKSTGLPVRLAFAGLWCAADREGRFKWEPRKLKAQILPYDDEVDFSRVLDALNTRGFLVKYTSQGKEFGCIPSFTKHQFVNGKEAPSILPAPLNFLRPPPIEPVDASSTREPHENNACSTRPSCSLPVPVPVPFPSEGESEGKQPDASSVLQASAKQPKIDRYHPDCRTVLHFLNETACVHYREVHANLNIISERLFEPDVTLEGVKAMIQRQSRKWRGTEYADYLRPETLFRKSKFDGYYAAREQPISTNGKPDHRAEKAAKEYPQVITAKLL